MKRFIALAAALCLALSLCGCAGGRALSGGWAADRLAPASEPAAPEGVSMALMRAEPEFVDVILRNDSGAKWKYDQGYRLDVLLGDDWYGVPKPGRKYFSDVTGALEDGVEVEILYDLSPFGPLPSGCYRFVANGLTAVFELGNS